MFIVQLEINNHSLKGIIMPKARKLTEAERARILDFSKQGLSQRAIADKVNRRKL